MVLKPFFDSISIEPVCLSLYEEALTHKSAHQLGINNERLEFLGDRILGLSIAILLYKHFVESTEGNLAKRQAVLVSKETLLKVAYDIHLPNYLLVSKALQQAKKDRVESLYANAVEALIAAIYLDLGFETADAFIHRYWQKYITDVQEAPTDSKSKLQEWTQRYGLPIPTYDIVSQTGPAHAPLFHIRVSVQGHGSEIVEAQSRRKGEHLASKNLLERIMNT